MSLYSDLNEVLTPYAQKIKGLSAADAEIKADLDVLDERVEALEENGVTPSPEPEIDRTTSIVDLFVESKLCKWNNGTPSYTQTPDCLELTLDIVNSRSDLPSGLSNGVDILRCSSKDESKYGFKYILQHNGQTVYIDRYESPANLQGVFLMPIYDDLELIRVYVFIKDGTALSIDDIDTIKSNIDFTICDIIHGPGVSCNRYLNPSYGVEKYNLTFFGYGQETRIKTIQHIDYTTPPNTIVNFIGALNNQFAVLGTLNKPSISNLANNNVYIQRTCVPDAPVVTWDDIVFTITNNDESVYFWYIYTGAISENLKVLNNASETPTYTISQEDIDFLKNQFSELGEYKGVFDRIINRGNRMVFSPSFNPAISKTDQSYYDVLERGEDGDWYIYAYRNDLAIKNAIATYGDIIYRKSSTTYLVIKNPIKWGNYKTIPQSTYDVVIVGGGAGGIGAAYSLIESGLKVLLVDKMSGLGGTHTQAGLCSLISSPVGDWFKEVCREGFACSAVRFATFSSEFGTLTTFDDYWNAALATNPNTRATMLTVANPNWLSKKYHDDLVAGGIDIRYRRKFLRHNDANGKISSLVFLNEITGIEEKVFAKCVIDCTGDVYVGRYNRTIDEDYYIGSDPYTLYNEPAASNISEGSHYDINTCEIMYQYGTHGTGNITNDFVPFTNSDEYADKSVDFKPIDGVTNKHNSGLDNYYYADPNGFTANPFSNGAVFPKYSAIVSPDYYCGLTKEMFVDYGEERLHEIARDYAKAHYLIKYKNTSTYFIGEFPLLAIREGYRMKCEYMVTQEDVEDTITNENYAEKKIVALSSWYADIHQNTKVNVNAIQNTYKNGIPYLAMVPTSYKNLLIACRGYGASHIGLSGIRLIKTMMSLGYAAGYAAKQYVTENLMDMRNVDVAQLQSDIGIGELITYLETNIYPNYES